MARTREHPISSVNTGNELYQDTIGAEALARAGNNKQLKGVVHELLFRDKLNTNPANIHEGKTAVLTKNPTAHAVDVVQMKDGKCVGRFQLKDTTSDSGVRDTLSRTRSHQYRSAKLMGTEETTQKYNASISANDKRMESTGISSKRTGRIADNAGVNSPSRDTFLNNMQDVGSCAVDSFCVGAAISAVFAIIFSLMPTIALAWDGYDYEAGNFVEIEKDNLVRSGRDIEIYDYNSGEFHDVHVNDIDRYGSNVELDVYDYTTGQTRTLEMDGD